MNKNIYIYLYLFIYLQRYICRTNIYIYTYTHVFLERTHTHISIYIYRSRYRQRYRYKETGYTRLRFLHFPADCSAEYGECHMIWKGLTFLSHITIQKQTKQVLYRMYIYIYKYLSVYPFQIYIYIYTYTYISGAQSSQYFILPPLHDTIMPGTKCCNPVRSG